MGTRTMEGTQQMPRSLQSQRRQDINDNSQAMDLDLVTPSKS